MHALPPRLPVQQIWDHIIAFLAHSRDDLLACSATCRAFVLASQPHLFHDIVFLPPALAGDFHDWRTARGYDEAAACHRLCEILVESPHLIRYIRRIKVHLDAQLLTRLAAIPLSNVRQVYLRNAAFSMAEDTLPHLARQLVGLPSVQQVRIWTTPRTPALLTTILGDGSARLRSSRMFCVAFLGDIAAVQPVAQRSPITELRLDSSAQLSDWFAQPGCPLDLNRLTDVYIHESMSTNLRKILYAVGNTIQRLRLAALDTEDLDLNSFHALTELVIYIGDPEDDLPDVETALAHLDDHNNIHTITLEIAPFFPIDAPVDTFQALDAAIAARTMSSLRHFVARFVGPGEDRPSDEVGILRSLFPRIYAKGILVVAVLDDAGEMADQDSDEDGGAGDFEMWEDADLDTA
ncbi:hypothetical protein B0H17DRAFT_1201279 [Mycena rosella]|uniref:Uncharacterized protein n=1 Tax=Mycena rosella TaxID=1033263 RepID=A0AAD7DGI2_MYCRO|nr:hypothetical protein B0H17DRAFT_1201279 [Mycena rosella]